MDVPDRLGGGYKQREKRRKLAAAEQKQMSGLAKYLVFKTPFLDTTPIVK